MKPLLFAIFSILTAAPVFSFDRDRLPQQKPFVFLENKGQVIDQYGKTRKDIDAKLEAPGMVVFIGNGAIHYQWQKAVAGDNAEKKDRTRTETYRLDVELVGANNTVRPVFEDNSTYYENYYLPQCAEGVEAGSFGRLVYRDIYPSIDWVLYVKDGALKYDFVVREGGDASQIKLRYKGATALGLQNGELIAATPMGSLTEGRPYCYSSNGTEIPSTYELEDNQLSFSIAGEHPGNFIIDPSILWATYYGGAGGEDINTVGTDNVNNIYAAGDVTTSTNMATAGSYQQAHAGSTDAFIVKFTPGGTRLWATYYGGTVQDEFNACAIAPDGTGYFGGYSVSNGLATAGSHQTSRVYTYAGLLVKFNASGQRIWATYYDGTQFSGGSPDGTAIRSVALDWSGNVLFCGPTSAGTGIATPGAAQTTTSGYNGYLAKFNANGVRLWGTYLGSGAFSVRVDVYGISSDAANNIYVSGIAEAGASNVSTAGSFQPSISGGKDGFIVKYSSAGAKLWGSFYGGTQDDGLSKIAAAANGDVYAFGVSGSSGLASAGTHQTSPGGGTLDGLIVKFSTTGTRLWASYYGGAGFDYIMSGWLGADDKLYLAGYTGSSTGIATSNVPQPNIGGGTDAFLATFTNTGARSWATYLGGFSGEQGNAVCYSPNGNIIVGGFTGTTSGLATAGSHQATYGGGSGDGLLASYTGDTAVYLLMLPSLPNTFCKGDSVTVFYGSSYPLQATNVFTIQLSNASGSFASPTSLGSVTAQTGGSMKVLIPSSLPNGNGYRVRITSSAPALISVDNGFDLAVGPKPAKPVATTVSPVCADDTLKLFAANMSGVTWGWEGPNSFSSSSQNPFIPNVTTAATGDYIVSAIAGGCASKDTVSVTVGIVPVKPVAATNTPICAGSLLALTASTSTPGVSWTWNGPGNFTSTQQNPVIAATKPADSGDYIVTASINGCSSSDTVNAIITNVSSIGAYASPNDTFCEGTQLTMVAVPFNMGASPQYQWFKNGTLIPGATALVLNVPTYTTGDSFYCRMIATGVCAVPLTLYTPGIKITVLPITSTPSVSVTSNPSPALPGILNNFTATATNGGPNPAYQWKRNGTDMAGATYAVWSASGLHPYDKITCVVNSSDPCATPKSASSSALVVNFPTGIKDANDGPGVGLYPNPTNGSFNFSSNETGTLYLYNMTGQKLATYEVNEKVSTHQLPSSLSAGIYTVQFIGNSGSVTVSKIEYLP